MDKLYIACAGLATSGKSLFSTLLKQRLALKYPHLKYSEFALAEKLKLELQPIVKELYDIDIFNCTPEEKELIRPLMVLHGKMKRIRTSGRHWVEILEPKLRASTCDINVITDLRYDDFPNDEVSWCQKELGGLLVHISLFNKIVNAIGFGNFPNPDNFIGYTSVPQEAPNDDEARNNPKLQAKADYRISWEKQSNGNYEPLYPIVDKFIDFLGDRIN